MKNVMYFPESIQKILLDLRGGCICWTGCAPCSKCTDPISDTEIELIFEKLETMFYNMEIHIDNTVNRLTSKFSKTIEALTSELEHCKKQHEIEIKRMYKHFEPEESFFSESTFELIVKGIRE